MQRPLQVTFHGVDHSDALARRIRKEASKLERFSDHIIGCHVTVQAPHQHMHQGQIFEVRLAIDLPHREIVVSKEGRFDPAHEDAQLAVRDAFDVACRQIDEHVERQRGPRRSES